MFKVTGTKIYLTRGDTAFLDIQLWDESGAIYEPQEGDKVIFRLKKVANVGNVLLEKEVDTSTMILELEEDDTKSLNFQPYKYEVELVTASGQHYTAIENADFEIGVELENHDGENNG